MLGVEIFHFIPRGWDIFMSSKPNLSSLWSCTSIKRFIIINTMILHHQNKFHFLFPGNKFDRVDHVSRRKRFCFPNTNHYTHLSHAYCIGFYSLLFVEVSFIDSDKTQAWPAPRARWCTINATISICVESICMSVVNNSMLKLKWFWLRTLE